MKKFLIVLFILFVLLIIVGVVLWNYDFSRGRQMKWGVNFSQPQASYLGLDWKKVYLALLDDLKVRNLRLQAYWPLLEKERGKFDFIDLDWQVKEAKKRDAKIIMVLGRRQPHWPECHSPEWAKGLNEKETQEKILSMLERVVKHYKKESAILIWQVDNEPLVDWFGVCPLIDKEFIKREIALVKSIDFRPILITDSGELSFWYEAKKLGGDFLGTTMYRVVWNKTAGYLNYKYLIPPAFYYFRARALGIYPDGMIISELQAEPWQRIALEELSLEEQRQSFDAIKFKANTEFARRVGFGSAYLWGAEYWAWLKEKNGDASLWEEARLLFR